MITLLLLFHLKNVNVPVARKFMYAEDRIRPFKGLLI